MLLLLTKSLVSTLYACTQFPTFCELWILYTYIAIYLLFIMATGMNTSSFIIGACRAVWVPRQDLAMLHLMRNCRKRILSLHCMLYVRPCKRKHAYAIYRGLEACHVSSRPVLVI